MFCGTRCVCLRHSVPTPRMECQQGSDLGRLSVRASLGRRPESLQSDLAGISFSAWILLVAGVRALSRASAALYAPPSPNPSLRAGLEFYTPSTRAWRQAHMQARYVILRVLLEAGGGLLTLQRGAGADGEPDVRVQLRRELIASTGREAIGAFLLKLQVHKSLGDLEAGSAMCAHACTHPRPSCRAGTEASAADFSFH